MLKHSPFLFVSLVLILLTSCHEPKALEYRDFRNLKLENVSFSGAALTVDVIYYNPNNFGLELNRTDLDVFVDSTFLGHSAQDVQVAVKKKAEFTIPIRLELDMKNLLKNGLNSFFNKSVAVRVLGSVKVGKAGIYKSFPVDYTTVQTLSLFK